MFCHLQVSQLRHTSRRFEEVGAQVFLIQANESSRILDSFKASSIEPEALGVPVLADAASCVSATYGVAYQMSVHVELRDRPGAFIVDRDGILRLAHRGASYNDRYYADDLLDELARLREGRGADARY